MKFFALTSFRFAALTRFRITVQLHIMKARHVLRNWSLGSNSVMYGILRGIFLRKTFEESKELEESFTVLFKN